MLSDTDEYIYSEVGKLLVTCGYGRSEFNNIESPLRWISLPLIDWTKCKDFYLHDIVPETITDKMCCIGNITEKFFTESDSGGKTYEIYQIE